MSRIGKKPVAIPTGVTATIEGGLLSVKGPKGTLSLPLAEEVSYAIEDGQISVQPSNATKRARSYWGMQRTLVQNLITGVTEGFTKVLEITGVGYRANAQGRNLKLQLGYSHDVDFAIPEGIEIKRSEEPTSELQSLMRISYAVFCLKKKKNKTTRSHTPSMYQKHRSTNIPQR